MKRKIIILILLVHSVYAFSQKAQTIIWGDSLFFVPYYAILDLSNNIVIAGSDITPSKTRKVLVKIKNGEVKNYYIQSQIQDTGTYCLNIAQLSNGNYICAGTYYVGGSSNNKAPIFFSVFDTNLNLITEKTYDLPPQYTTGWKFRCHQESEDTLLYLFQAKVPYEFSSWGFDLGLIRITSTGDTVESKYYPYSSDSIDLSCEVFDIRNVPNTEQYIISIKSGTMHYRNIILNHNLSVDTIFEYDDIEPLYGLWGNRNLAYWQDDNTFFTAGDGFLPTKGDMALFAAKFSIQGSVLNSVVLNQTEIDDQSAVTCPIVAANDSTIYILGHDMCYGCDPVTSKAVMEVFTVNKNLDVLGYNIIGEDGYYRSLQVLTNKNGDMIAIGAINVGDTYHFNLYVTQIPREELGLVTSVVNCESKLQDIAAYPNPATDIIYFRIGKLLKQGVRIILHTITGKTALSKPVKGNGNTIEVNITNLPKGVYLYEIIYKDIIINNGKFIKQ